MGQKVNPIGLRLGINRSWDSMWYAKKSDYSKFLIEDHKIREYIRKNIVNAGVSEIIIERSSKIIVTLLYGFFIGDARPFALGLNLFITMDFPT